MSVDKQEYHRASSKYHCYALSRIFATILLTSIDFSFYFPRRYSVWRSDYIHCWLTIGNVIYKVAILKN